MRQLEREGTVILRPPCKGFISSDLNSAVSFSC